MISFLSDSFLKGDNDLVRMSDKFKFVPTLNGISIILVATHSLTRWKQIDLCFFFNLLSANEAFLNEMPEFEGYPFLVITDKEGQVLNSRTSGALEEGLGYSEAKFKAYFEYWKNAELDN